MAALGRNTTMTDTDAANPSILSHVSIGTRNFERATSFYDAVLATLGCRRVMEHPGAVAYGRAFPEFWVQVPIDGKSASAGNGTHFGFFASSAAEVNAFHAAGVAAGATDDGKPGPRAEYGAPYYGCFLRDPDGHKIEAAYWDLDMAEKLGMA
jgi:catechol 2,3-dioxygenase-like lactoylglutathione lyase family enzyme